MSASCTWSCVKVTLGYQKTRLCYGFHRKASVGELARWKVTINNCTLRLDSYRLLSPNREKHIFGEYSPQWPLKYETQEYAEHVAAETRCFLYLTRTYRRGAPTGRGPLGAPGFEALWVYGAPEGRTQRGLWRHSMEHNVGTFRLGYTKPPDR